ncbi:hypothetical protein CBR_g51795 [Chara braunii]|uniref:Uncharacterized protein n=1 Tax=Chara braunii TaxID=69332 RepID=A0A388M920_CHABU|nr:hypothetical protein CBR_g51795 [Chara braunii]|eukprot:GBG91061.1 hypothetical protein CBR_g51795 [Chara braunii]
MAIQLSYRMLRRHTPPAQPGGNELLVHAARQEHGGGANSDGEGREGNRGRGDFEDAVEWVRNLPPPRKSDKWRIKRMVILEMGETAVGWLILTVCGMLVGSFGGDLSRWVFWIAVVLFLIEAVQKLARNFLHHYYTKDVPCSLLALHLVEKPYHKCYLVTVWYLRVVGFLAQGALAIWLTWINKKKHKKRREEMVHLCYAIVYLKTIFSIVITCIQPFCMIPFWLASFRRRVGHLIGLLSSALPRSSANNSLAILPAAGEREGDQNRQRQPEDGRGDDNGGTDDDGRGGNAGDAEQENELGEEAEARAVAAAKARAVAEAEARGKAPALCDEGRRGVGTSGGPSGEGCSSSSGIGGRRDSEVPPRPRLRRVRRGTPTRPRLPLGHPKRRCGAEGRASGGENEICQCAGDPQADPAAPGAAPPQIQPGGIAQQPQQGGGGAREGEPAADNLRDHNEARMRAMIEAEKQGVQELQEEMAVLVWYVHCKQHPLLPAVGAALQDGCSNCGLPGNWFLDVEQLLALAFSPSRKDAINAQHPVWHSIPCNLTEWMALDALGRLVKSGDVKACELIVEEKSGRFQKIVDIVGDHTSMECREQAAAIIWHLANLKAKGLPRNGDGGRPYDPLCRVSNARMAKAAVALLSAVVGGEPSAKLQENAMAALLHLTHRHGVKEFVFSGEEGKARVEQLVDTAAKASTNTICLYALYLLGVIVYPPEEYANYTALESLTSFDDLNEWSKSRRSRLAPRRYPPPAPPPPPPPPPPPVMVDEGGRPPAERKKTGSVERLWIVPARACFRESKALPRLISLALSHGSSRDSKELIAFVLESYHVLGAGNLFPFEITELTRLLQVRYFTSPPELVFTAMLTCDLLLSYLYQAKDERQGACAGQLINYLVRRCGRTFYKDLVRLQLDSWGSPEFKLAKEGRSTRWKQFMLPFLNGNSPSPSEELLEQFRKELLEKVFSAPARLMAYLLAHHYNLLRTEVRDVCEDDWRTRKSENVIDNIQNIKNKMSLAGTTVAAFGLADLLGANKDLRTKLHACTALYRLAERDEVDRSHFVRPAYQWHVLKNRVDKAGLATWQPFQELVELMGDNLD